MKIIDSILKNMDDILGLPADEMADQLDLNLFEDGLIDSLSVIELMGAVERELGIKINIKEMTPEDLATVNAMAAAIEAQAGV